MIFAPRTALLLGLAGTLPFIWGVVSMAAPDLGLWVGRTSSPRFVGPYVQLSYGTVILAFMSGVLWGFSTITDGPRARVGYILSVIRALWAFFMAGSDPVSAARNLVMGFTGLLVLDWVFCRWELAPPWWLHLRILLTLIVATCLILGMIL